MKPVDFPQANFTYTRPATMTAEQCGDLRVYKGNYPGGPPVSISCFEVSDDELREIIKTKKIWLHVIGISHPPVSLTAESPWEDK